MARSELRNDLVGFSGDQDRLWKITKDGQVYVVTDYNNEITGWTKALADLFIGVGTVSYGLYWNYFRDMLLQQGFQVEQVEDRR